MSVHVDCFICGLCCTALSISSLNKDTGVPCKYLLSDNKCSIYEERPQVCRDFKADSFCVLLKTLSRKEQIEVIKDIFDA